MKTRIFWVLAIFAFAVLGAAAVWMGGLNQDEGWYLYAANLVAEGQVPYRDFFYTQGPLMPLVYSVLTPVWKLGGLLGARILTLLFGAMGVALAMGLARRLSPADRRNEAALVVFLLLGCNLYHLYYVAIPKTYALASVFVLAGFFLLSFCRTARTGAAALFSAGAGLSLAFAAGTRISLAALLAVVGLTLLLSRRWRTLAGFCVGGFAGLSLVYLPFLCDAGARAGLIAAQQYHAARAGFDPVWTVGSLSRLVRWYLPVFIVCGLGLPGWSFAKRGAQDVNVLFYGCFAVFAVQMLAPFPYEDYQVPVMGLLAVFAAATFLRASDPSASRLFAHSSLLLVLGLSFATSFGSPLLERWMTNGQDRFWSLKKEKTELAQLRDVARRIARIDPGGRDLLTQDLYLAIEADRKVPKGLEMGPFAMLSDADWRKLVESAPCAVAAMSGYAFAIKPPACTERPIEEQMVYWGLLKKNYKLVDREEAFGQNATPLLVLKRQ